MNYLTWILEEKLATRPGPVEVPWDLNILKEAGVKAIFSISNENESESISKTDISHYKYYTNDVPLHSEVEIEEFLNIIKPAIDEINKCILNEKAVLVHCHAGRDRSGAVVACYLVKYENYSAVAALKSIRNLKEYCVYPGYEEAVSYYEKNYI